MLSSISKHYLCVLDLTVCFRINRENKNLRKVNKHEGFMRIQHYQLLKFCCLSCDFFVNYSEVVKSAIRCWNMNEKMECSLLIAQCWNSTHYIDL